MAQSAVSVPTILVRFSATRGAGEPQSLLDTLENFVEDCQNERQHG